MQCLLNNNPLSKKDQAQPAKNRLKEVQRAQCLQLGLHKDNSGAFRLDSVCSFTFLREEVLSSIQLKT